MKTIFLMLVCSIEICGALYAATPPVSVKKAFEAKFTTATNVKWGKEGTTEWEATFSFEGDKLSANFAEDGKWLETESAIKSKAVPSSVTKAIQTDFPGYKTIERQSIEKPDSKEFIYEIHIKKDKEVVKLQYSTDGKQLTKSVKTEK